MFFLKKLISPLLFPVPVVWLLLLAGLVLLWRTRRQRAGKIFVTAGALLFALLTFGPLPGLLLSKLERQHPSFELSDFDVNRQEELRRSVKWIVVLGGGHVSDPSVPASSRLAHSSLTRLVEGVRLKREFPGAKLLLSGAQVFDKEAVAEGMRRVAQSLGVEADDVVLDLKARDTEEEARVVREMIGDERMILITSAAHMPRSVALFRKAGLDPLPAPTDFVVKRSQGAGPADRVPSAGGLIAAELAVYEYLGLLWAKVRGRI